MSWHFSQALVAEYLAANSSGGARFAPSSGTPTPLLFCAPDRMTAFSRLSRFGLTFRPLTADLGADVLTWFLAAFPARTSAQPAREKESTASGLECGDTWLGSLAKYDRDSSSWKTPQCSFLEGLDEFLETWPRWGMMRGGVCWALSIPAHLTSESESGSWPTPRANDGEKRGNFDLTNPRNGLAAAAKLWPTPLATDGANGGPNQKGSKGDLRLSSAVHLWPTPTVCGNYNRKGASATAGDGLATAVTKFATPQARDFRSGQASRWDDPRRTRNLNDQIAKWPTPTACMSKGSSPAALTRKDGQSRENDRLDHAVMAANGGSLNPTWVEWLMGWPLGWTDCAASATDKFPQWQHSHGGL